LIEPLPIIGVACANTFNPASDWGTCGRSYPEASDVALTATASAGSTLAGWEGACVGVAACNLDMNAARAVSAVFRPSATAGSGGTRPVIGAARESAKRWREGARLVQISASRKPPLGTVFSFSLNEQASVTFRFTRAARGRIVDHRCVRATRKNKGDEACKRSVTAGTLGFRGRQGVNRVRFQGRLGRSRRLRPGRYTLVIEADNPAGRSAPTRLAFAIVR
jgi:hypothetical protein